MLLTFLSWLNWKKWVNTMKYTEYRRETQNYMLSELNKLFKLIWQKKKKCCDYYNVKQYCWFKKVSNLGCLKIFKLIELEKVS